MRMMHAKILLAVLFLGMTCCACSSSSPGPFQSDGDTDELIDGDVDTMTTDGDADGDMETESEDPVGGECRFPEHCSDEQDCVEGVCRKATRCMGGTDCNINQICWFPDHESAWGRCRIFCMTDMECDDDGQCIDGICEKYIPFPEGDPPPEHPDWEGKLHASYAEGWLDFPMNTTMMGHIARDGANGPYQVSMGGGSGAYDRLDIKVMTMDDGKKRVVFIRVPICFPTDFLVSSVVRRVIELGGPDLDDSVVFSTGHTHSGPGRFWYLLPHLHFGGLGFGEFSFEIFRRLVDSIAQVVYEAQDEELFRKARFGYAFNENFDPEDLINRDRRPENDEFKDNRLMIWRVDDLSGPEPKPWILTITYATHGTVEGNLDTFYSADSAGGAELTTQLYYERDHAGDKINTMFFNGMGGDVMPSGVGLGVKHTQKMQLIGHRVYGKVMQLFEMLDSQDTGGNPDLWVSKMTDSLDISVISKRVPIDRDYIGYSDDEFYSDGVSFGEFIEGPIRFGGFQCGLLSTPAEENLNLHLYDESGTLIDEAMRVNTAYLGENLRFTPESAGTYYILVDGLDGCMADYALEVFESSRGRRSDDPCIDSRCGFGCDQCPPFKDMVPSTCDEDIYDLNGNNDSRDKAVALDLNVELENLQVCPFNEDWFKVELAAGQRVTIELRWDQDNMGYNEHTAMQDGHLGCALLVEALNGSPIPQFSKTRFTSVLFDGPDMGGGFYMAGLPGEPNSRVGFDTIRAMEEVTDFEKIAIFGYNNDHHFYIQTEDDWLQGGYNTSMSVWGPKFGPFVIEHLKQIAVHINNDSPEDLAAFANEFSKVKPLNFKNIEDDTRVPEITTADQIGVFADNPKTFQPQDTVRMEQQASMRWVGGDPGVDFPHIFLERKDPDGQWQQVLRKEGSGRIYDDRFYEMKVEFENEHFSFPNLQDADNTNYWTATWEESYYYPLGEYRFRVAGRRYEGPTDSFDLVTGLEDYSLYSDGFNLLPASIEIQAFSYSEEGLGGSIRYGRPVSNDTGDNLFDTVRTKALILHSADAEPYLGPQVMMDEIVGFSITIDESDRGRGIVIEKADIALEEGRGVVYFVAARRDIGDQISQRENKPLTLFKAPLPKLTPGSYSASIEIADVHGNVGSLVIPFEVPLADADGDTDGDIDSEIDTDIDGDAETTQSAGLCSLSGDPCEADDDCQEAYVDGWCLERTGGGIWSCLYDTRRTTGSGVSCAGRTVGQCGSDYDCPAGTECITYDASWCGATAYGVCTHTSLLEEGLACNEDTQCKLTGENICIVCGDGEIDTTQEQCDDLNAVAGDGCSSICRYEGLCLDSYLDSTYLGCSKSEDCAQYDPECNRMYDGPCTCVFE